MTQTKVQAKKEREKLLQIFEEEAPSSPSDGNLEALLGEYTKKSLNSGDIVKGKVIAIRDDFALVDVGYKSEGIVPLSDFSELSGKVELNPGDELEVFIEKVENDSGMVVLSKSKADMMKVWEDITESIEKEKVVQGTVLARVKGGYKVDIGVKAFLPGSQLDYRPPKDLDSLVGKKMDFRIIKFNKKRGNIVLSRRVLMEAERKNLREQSKEKIEEGAVVDGIVKNITDYGAFLDLGGLDGLLHITDMSWGRIKSPTEIVSVGDKVRVKILKYDEEKQRVALGLKQLKENPWEKVDEKYSVGKVVPVEVVNVTDFGAFVRLEQNVEGFIHISEISWDKKVKDAKEILKVGEKSNAVILTVDKQAHRITLSLKKADKNSWDDVEEKYTVGSEHDVKVVNMADFGVFVELEKGVEGLIHVSELDTKRVKSVSDVVSEGDILRAEVVSIDKASRKIDLSAKVVKLRQEQVSQKQEEEDKRKEMDKKSKSSLGDILGKALGLKSEKKKDE